MHLITDCSFPEVNDEFYRQLSQLLRSAGSTDAQRGRNGTSEADFLFQPIAPTTETVSLKYVLTTQFLANIIQWDVDPLSGASAGVLGRTL